MGVAVGPIKKAHFHPSDLRSLARLATDAATGLVNLVEDLHMRVAPPPKALGPAGTIAPLTYGATRGALRAIGGGAQATLGEVAEALGRREDSPQRRAILAVLNGLWGDYLAASDSPLALPMAFDFGDEALAPPRGKIAVLVHGLCMNGAGWRRGSNGSAHDHGAALARDLGYAPVYLTYNSGLHISRNGRALALMLEALVTAWPVPVEEVTLIGHSMGGLVARSAAHYGAAEGRRWPGLLRALVLLGAPHHGAPLERGGHWLQMMLEASPYMAPFTRLGKRRSAGITDLRYGALVDEDWLGRDRFAPAPDERRLVPLPDGPRAFALAGAISRADTRAARLLGDGLVPLDSALGRHVDPARALPFDGANSWTGYGMTHLDLLGRRAYERLAAWLA